MANLGENNIDGDTTIETLTNQEQRNKRVVTTLYEAFNKNKNNNNTSQISFLFAPYLEWWFHGPPSHQHLKRLLTGTSPNDMSFPLVPFSITAFESTVMVEGCDENRSVAWVHTWTLSDGIIIHVREYYNTSVTVTLLGGGADVASSSLPEIKAKNKCQSVWQSKLCDESSVPGLVLAL